MHVNGDVKRETKLRWIWLPINFCYTQPHKTRSHQYCFDSVRMYERCYQVLVHIYISNWIFCNDWKNKWARVWLCEWTRACNLNRRKFASKMGHNFKHLEKLFNLWLQEILWLLQKICTLSMSGSVVKKHINVSNLILYPTFLVDICYVNHKQRIHYPVLRGGGRGGFYSNLTTQVDF